MFGQSALNINGDSVWALRNVEDKSRLLPVSQWIMASEKEEVDAELEKRFTKSSFMHNGSVE